MMTLEEVWRLRAENDRLRAQNDALKSLNTILEDTHNAPVTVVTSDPRVRAATPIITPAAHRDALQAQAEAMTELALEITTFFSLRSDLRTFVHYLEGERRWAALRKVSGQFGAAWLRMSEVVTRHGGQLDAAPNMALREMAARLEEALRAALITRDLSPLLEELESPDFEYQHMYAGLETIGKSGARRAEVWNWLIDQGERIKARYGKAYTWKRQIIPDLLQLAERDDSAPQEAITWLRTARDDADQLAYFRENYRKAAKRRGKGGT